MKNKKYHLDVTDQKTTPEITPEITTDPAATGRAAFALDQVFAAFTLSQIFGQVINQKLAEQLGSNQAARKKLKEGLKVAGISQPTWSRIMGGKTDMAFDRMKYLCDCLNLEFMPLLSEVLALSKKLCINGHLTVSPSHIGMRSPYDSRPSKGDHQAAANGASGGGSGSGAQNAAHNPQKPQQKPLGATKDILRYFIEQVKVADSGGSGQSAA